LKGEFKVFKSTLPKLPWKVDGRIDGTRTRRFFELKDDAETWADRKNKELERHGVAGEISDELRMEASVCDQLLKPLKATLMDATRYYIAHQSVAARSKKMGSVLDELIGYTAEEVDNNETSKEHQAGILKVSKRLRPVFGDRLASEIQKHEIKTWIDGLEHIDESGALSATSKDYFRRYVTSIFSFAEERGYIAEGSNPAHGIAKMGRKGSIGILAPHEVSALLHNCHPSMVPFYSIGIFAGLRPYSEIARLDWNKFDWEDNMIEVSNVKTAGHFNSARERYVEISPNLLEWLKPHRKGVGRVMPGNWRDHMYGSCKGRTVKFPTDREKAISYLEAGGFPAFGLKDWAQDCMRHTYASMHYARYEDSGKTASQMGHLNSQMVFNAYRRKVKPKDADKFWSISPL
jgi:integrase